MCEAPPHNSNSSRMARFAFVEVDHVVYDGWFCSARTVKSMFKVTNEWLPTAYHGDDGTGYIIIEKDTRLYFATQEAQLTALIALRSAVKEMYTACPCRKHNRVFVQLQTPQGPLPIMRLDTAKDLQAWSRFGTSGLVHESGFQIWYESSVERDKALNRYAEDVKRAYEESGWKKMDLLRA